MKPNKPISKFSTQRLCIRPLTLSDSEFMLELVNSSGWLKFIGDRGVSSTEQAIFYISKILKTPSFYYSVIQKLDSLEPVGILSFIQRENLDAPDFGFALLPKFYKMGYAREASAAYLKKVVAQNPSSPIIAICWEENETSINLLKKLGFYFRNAVNQNKQLLHIYEIKPEQLLKQTV
jgi:ribosomal-protein-alanine N-acetyltransferase